MGVTDHALPALISILPTLNLIMPNHSKTFVNMDKGLSKAQENKRQRQIFQQYLPLDITITVTLFHFETCLNVL